VLLQKLQELEQITHGKHAAVLQLRRQLEQAKRQLETG
jgi:hypothetical protein